MDAGKDGDGTILSAETTLTSAGDKLSDRVSKDCEEQADSKSDNEDSISAVEERSVQEVEEIMATLSASDITTSTLDGQQTKGATQSSGLKVRLIQKHNPLSSSEDKNGEHNVADLIEESVFSDDDDQESQSADLAGQPQMPAVSGKAAASSTITSTNQKEQRPDEQTQALLEEATALLKDDTQQEQSQDSSNREPDPDPILAEAALAVSDGRAALSPSAAPSAGTTAMKAERHDEKEARRDVPRFSSNGIACIAIPGQPRARSDTGDESDGDVDSGRYRGYMQHMNEDTKQRIEMWRLFWSGFEKLYTVYTQMPPDFGNDDENESAARNDDDGVVCVSVDPGDDEDVHPLPDEDEDGAEKNKDGSAGVSDASATPQQSSLATAVAGGVPSVVQTKAKSESDRYVFQQDPVVAGDLNIDVDLQLDDDLKSQSSRGSAAVRARDAAEAAEAIRDIDDNDPDLATVIGGATNTAESGDSGVDSSSDAGSESVYNDEDSPVQLHLSAMAFEVFAHIVSHDLWAAMHLHGTPFVVPPFARENLLGVQLKTRSRLYAQRDRLRAGLKVEDAEEEPHDPIAALALEKEPAPLNETQLETIRAIWQVGKGDDVAVAKDSTKTDGGDEDDDLMLPRDGTADDAKGVMLGMDILSQEEFVAAMVHPLGPLVPYIAAENILSAQAAIETFIISPAASLLTAAAAHKDASRGPSMAARLKEKLPSLPHVTLPSSRVCDTKGCIVM